MKGVFMFIKQLDFMSDRVQGKCVMIQKNRYTRYCRLHETNVFEIQRKCSTWVKLHTGGFKTAMTKWYINLCFRANNLPAYVYQKNKQWFVRINNSELDLPIIFPFVEGIELSF
jgi:hypothetical protein